MSRHAGIQTPQLTHEQTHAATLCTHIRLRMAIFSFVCLQFSPVDGCTSQSSPVILAVRRWNCNSIYLHLLHYCIQLSSSRDAWRFSDLGGPRECIPYKVYPAALLSSNIHLIGGSYVITRFGPNLCCDYLIIGCCSLYFCSGLATCYPHLLQSLFSSLRRFLTCSERGVNLMRILTVPCLSVHEPMESFRLPVSL